MNRRTFFKAATGAAVTATSGSIAMAGFDWFMEENPGYTPFNAVVASYDEYVNFSDFAIAEAIDKHVAQAAKELGEAAGRKISFLYSTVSA